MVFGLRQPQRQGTQGQVLAVELEPTQEAVRRVHLLLKQRDHHVREVAPRQGELGLTREGSHPHLHLHLRGQGAEELRQGGGAVQADPGGLQEGGAETQARKDARFLQLLTAQSRNPLPNGGILGRLSKSHRHPGNGRPRSPINVRIKGQKREPPTRRDADHHKPRQHPLRIGGLTRRRPQLGSRRRRDDL